MVGWATCGPFPPPAADVWDYPGRHCSVGGGRAAKDFISLRETRDAELPMPKLIIPSLQINMRGGDMPAEDEGGKVMLRLPINKL